MKISTKNLQKIIQEELFYREFYKPLKESRGFDSENVTFEWTPGGLSMVMFVDGQEVMQFGTQKEVRNLISQLEELLIGPMRTSP